MKPIGWVLTVTLYVAAAVCDQAASAGQLFGAAGPDCLTVVALCVAVVSRPAVGALAGFIAGLLSGSIIGANMAQWIITRTLAGFGAALSIRLRVEVNSITAAMAVFIGVLISRVSYLFLISPPDLGPLLLQSIISSFISGLLALPVYALLSRTVAAERT